MLFFALFIFFLNSYFTVGMLVSGAYSLVWPFALLTAVSGITVYHLWRIR